MLKKRNKEDNLYVDLQVKTLKKLEELSGKVWTDFNTHDPGITISDYLNYALYDLNYRLQFPLENYLFDSTQDRNLSEKGLFSKKELYTEDDCEGKEVVRKSIVTEEDYDQLIMKTHHQDLQKCAIRLNNQTRRYDIFILSKNEQLNTEELTNIKDAVLRTYNKNRNLGEMVGEIYLDWKLQEDSKNYNLRKRSHNEVYEFPEFEQKQQSLSQNTFKSDYRSIQYDFPENYGLSEKGIPNPEDKDYHVKVLQLKAYLLIFDYLMANQLHQVGNVHKLLELSNNLPQDKLPEVKIKEGERLVNNDKKEQVEQLIQNDKFYQIQKFRHLNVIDRIYNEDTRHLFGKKDINSLNKKRAEILKSLPKSNEYRFRSFNIYEPNSVPVVQQLFEEVIKERFPSLTPVSTGQIRIVADELFFERYRFLLAGHKDPLVAYEKLDDSMTSKFNDDEAESLNQLRLHLNLIWHGVLPESMLEYGTDISNYKLASIADDYLLLFFHPEYNLIINMSLFSSDKNKLVEITYMFIEFLKQIRNNGYQHTLYIVEHILLDHNLQNSNLLSMVLPDQLENKDLEELFRERLPAHLRITLYYVSHGALDNFHTAYFNWRKALAEKDEKNISYYSGAIHFFFKYAEKFAKNI